MFVKNVLLYIRLHRYGNNEYFFNKLRFQIEGLTKQQKPEQKPEENVPKCKSLFPDYIPPVTKHQEWVTELKNQPDCESLRTAL